MLSSRSNDRDTRINYKKLNELGISLEALKDKTIMAVKQNKNNIHDDINDDFDER